MSDERTTARFILRYRGSGTKPASDAAQIRASAGVKILEETDTMVLVEGAEADLRALVSGLQGWAIAPESMVPLPDPRLKVLRRP
jgi:hypothetical protein